MRDAVRAKYGSAIAARLELLDFTYNGQAVSHYDDCAAAARTSDLDPASDLYKSCADDANPQLGPEIAAERQKIQVKRAYQEAQASEIANSIYGDPRGDAAYSSLFTGHALGDKPLIVLTRSMNVAPNPVGAAVYFVWNGVHEQTAALSTRGISRIVPDTHHNIQIWCNAIIDAISEVLGKVGTK